MHRFNISPNTLKEGLVTLSVEESHHALSVLRLKAGDVVELLDGQGGTFQGIVAGAEKGRVQVSVRETSVVLSAKKTVSITLAAAVIKPERMELLIQKACELGASAIVPLITERTVVHLSQERWASKIQRWQKIARESCKQCGQASMPAIQKAVDFKKFTTTLGRFDLSLIPTLAVPVKTLYDSLNAGKLARSVLLLIGPEGDFSKTEVQWAVSKGAQPVSLGPLVMRSETAAMYALAVVSFFYNEIALQGSQRQ